MINPGHGGNDSDDRGMPNGFWESEGNLTKGLWLRDLLESRGCEVIMSRVLNRTEDDLPLSQIAAIANENEVDLFISIHSNAGDQRTNYCMTIFNGKSETPAIPEAKVWAKILWEHLVTNQATYWTHTSPRYIGDLTLNPSWTYGYGVLYPLEVPGIISEGSMHDYRPEMDRLLNLEYRKQEAWNILYAMEEYFQLPGSEDYGNISGIIRDSLLKKDNYNIPESPDGYEVVNNAVVELLETGEKYMVDDLNTGYYYFDSLAPGNYKLVFSAQDYFNDTVSVNVESHSFTYHNHWLEADKTMPPKISGTDPVDGEQIECYDPVSISFNMNMDSASVANAFSIEPHVEGRFTWDEDYLTVSFLPVLPYDTGSLYTITLDTLAKHQWGVHSDTILNLSFETGARNRYILENTFPPDDAVEISPYLQVRLYFDAPVKNSTLIDAVYILSEEGDSLGTRGADISTVDGKGHYYFTPSDDLEYSTNYVLKLLGSIKDESNIPLVDTLEINFTTSEHPGILEVIEEYDDIKNWSIDFSRSPGTDASSFLYKWRQTYRSGEASMLLRYKFTEDGAYCFINPDQFLTVNTDAKYVGMWIWGEMSGNEIRLGFDNDEEKLLRVIDFAGWKYCTTEIPGNVNELQYLKLSHITGGSKNGDLYFDALSQPDISGISPHGNESVSIYPNPVADGKIFISGLKKAGAEYSILNLSGQYLKRGKLYPGENEIMLGTFTEQEKILILRLNTGSDSSSFLLMIK